ncbi:Protein of unknown function [Gryllus bimaculatus]|nr:Protein of unknown function [Gryllus bimaculatus]
MEGFFLRWMVRFVANLHIVLRGFPVQVSHRHAFKLPPCLQKCDGVVCVCVCVCVCVFEEEINFAPSSTLEDRATNGFTVALVRALERIVVERIAWSLAKRGGTTRGGSCSFVLPARVLRAVFCRSGSRRCASRVLVGKPKTGLIY